MEEAAFRRLISGETRGLAASVQRWGLQALVPGYAVAIAARNWAYDRGWLKSANAGIPVVSVGNLTTGGTGKTPFAAFLARWFREHDLRVAFVSRGYRSQPGQVNDEALVLDQLCPDVPLLQNPDRLAGALIAREELESQLVILDDAFQHRRLVRDLDIVLIDALNPWGYGHLLPRGLLREPRSALRRADVVVLTRVDLCPAESLARLRREVARWHQPACVEARFVPQRLIGGDGRSAPLTDLAGRRVAAFCGIGNPSAFRQLLAGLGHPVPDDRFREFRDHHAYTRDDVESLQRWARETGVEAVLTTQKDLVKLLIPDLADVPLWAAEIGTDLVAGADLLENRLQEILARADASS